MKHNSSCTIADYNIIRLVESYASARGVSSSTASRLLTGSGDTLKRIRCNMSLTARRTEKIIQKASDHWPADLTWPSDIPRPVKSRARENTSTTHNGGPCPKGERE